MGLNAIVEKPIGAELEEMVSIGDQHFSTDCTESNSRVERQPRQRSIACFSHSLKG